MECADVLSQAHFGAELHRSIVFEHLQRCLLEHGVEEQRHEQREHFPLFESYLLRQTFAEGLQAPTPLSHISIDAFARAGAPRSTISASLERVSRTMNRRGIPWRVDL